MGQMMYVESNQFQLFCRSSKFAINY